MGNPEAARAVLAALRDETFLVRRQAVKVLGRMRYRGAVPVLMEMLHGRDKLKRAEKILIREEICGVLSQIGDPNCLPALAEVALPPWFSPWKQTEVRVAAVKALGAFRGHGAEDILLRLAKDRNEFIRAAVEQALKSPIKSSQQRE
ncbi:HEAT repeat domain-containing protein [candidate division NPL-UPA2 bacterium]|nr:HEAT repeat domain-containing protein [candidate division NPL-UPA2 bacterium]